MNNTKLNTINELNQKIESCKLRIGEWSQRQQDNFYNKDMREMAGMMVEFHQNELQKTKNELNKISNN